MLRWVCTIEFSFYDNIIVVVIRFGSATVGCSDKELSYNHVFMTLVYNWIVKSFFGLFFYTRVLLLLGCGAIIVWLEYCF